MVSCHFEFLVSQSDVIFWFRLYVYMSVCMSVSMLFPDISKTIKDNFKKSNGIRSVLMEIRVHRPWFWNFTSGVSVNLIKPIKKEI